MKARIFLALLVACIVASCTSAPIASLLPSVLPTLPDRSPLGSPDGSGSPPGTTEPSAGPTSSPEATADQTPALTAEPSDLPVATDAPVATDSPAPSDGPPPTPASSPSATPQVGWTDAVLAAEGRYAQPDVLVDSQGIVHAVVAGAGNNNRGIWYLTNLTGAWTVEQVSVAPAPGGSPEGGYDGEPSMALDEDGDVWIAFTRWTCWECAPNPSVGIFLTTNEPGGDWVEPVQVTGDQTYAPSLLVRDGERHFAFAEGMVPGLRNYPVWYGNGTGDLDSLLIERIDRDGAFPVLDRQGGTVRVLYSGERIYFAEQDADGRFSTQPLPGSNEGFNGLLGVQRGTGAAVAAWTGDDLSGNRFALYAVRAGDTWQPPTQVVPDFDPADLEYARTGAVHLIGSGLTDATLDSLLYAVSPAPGGTFASETLAQLAGLEAAMALDDNTAQPTVIYTVNADGEQNGVWFLLGPAV